MSQEKCRWGILGRWNRQKIGIHPECRQCRLVAVASRGVGRAQDFIDRCSAGSSSGNPKAIGSYDEMLANEEIDAIYLPLPTGLRAEWAIKAAQAGKHLLCEKPCGIDLAELGDFGCLQGGGVQFMDGVMFMHSDRLRLRQTLDDGKALESFNIATQFSF